MVNLKRKNRRLLEKKLQKLEDQIDNLFFKVNAELEPDPDLQLELEDLQLERDETSAQIEELAIEEEWQDESAVLQESLNVLF